MKHLKKIAATALAAAALTALLGPASASATTLEKTGVTQNSSVSIVASAASGVSVTTGDTSGFSQNTCTKSELKASTASPYTGATVTGPVSTLTFTSCSNSVTTHKGGTLHISHIKNTTNGTVSSSEAEITKSSPFGTLACKTGSGTHIGTLAGVKHGNATMNINAVLSCSGISMRWEGTYTITTEGIGVSA